jgi:hypothetical protein
MPRQLTTPQKALRLLALLVHGAAAVEPPGPSGEVGFFKGEARLNALMFWLRNPDYLAEELLDLHESTSDPALLEQVTRMLVNEEPVLRRDAMPKWRFGAYEPIDDPMAILTSFGLVRTVMKLAGPKRAENDFLVFPRAYELAAGLAGNPAYAWYSDRMTLVLLVAGDRGGTALKEHQYKQFEYKNTQSSQLIRPITERVTARLNALMGG